MSMAHARWGRCAVKCCWSRFSATGRRCLELMAGPLRAVADDVRGQIMVDSGHFIPEERPEALTGLLAAFLADR
ncbi:hypothetical protein [Xanthomonas theicola]|uniref:hypothetical protein n=1 Tax=Xanthomonas theicola TaxID=56464 RepID=UPI000FF875BE|nr:hypothetical protein [Xanthomonas theicola]QNH26712.1 hypothetical protein G4Q83_21115 [Xanthomonas theicola]